MKYIKYYVIGIYFGIVLVKSEVVSWFRIQEMFYFHSFHMYGVLLSAIAVGLLTVFIINTFKLKAVNGEEINLEPKPFNKIGNITGGVIFGFGWALTGACPGPFYALLGAGYWTILIAFAAALVGVIAYGYLRPKLPH